MGLQPGLLVPNSSTDNWIDAPLLHRWAGTLLLSISLAAAGCSGELGAGRDSSIPDPDPLLVEVGAELFVTYCASCHGTDARGDGPAASAFRTPPADLTQIAARSGGVFPESSIARLIDGRFDLPAHGSREMPIWGARLSDPIPGFATGDEVARGRIASLVEYLKSLQVE
jgi:mono/diheme cytochrome c family protein